MSGNILLAHRRLPVTLQTMNASEVKPLGSGSSVARIQFFAGSPSVWVGAAGSGTETLTYDWDVAAYPKSMYEILLDYISGSSIPSGPAVDTWHSLSSTLTWDVSQFAFGSSNSNCTFFIRDALTKDVLATASATWLAQLT